MTRRKRYKRPPRDVVQAMSPAELAEHKRRINAEKQARYRKRFQALPKKERKKRRQEDGARAYSWERILPYIDKAESGCWHWRGSFHVMGGRLRPLVRAGVFGREPADFVVCCLARGRPPPNCFVKRTCANIDCVSPEHLVWSNSTVELAKRRRRHHEQGQGMAGRVE